MDDIECRKIGLGTVVMKSDMYVCITGLESQFFQTLRAVNLECKGFLQKSQSVLYITEVFHYS